ncbi:MAG: hypothetical protein WBC04_18425 [Candidatus Acidiferrales bacterium]
MRKDKPTKGELLPPNTTLKLRPDLNAMLKEAVEQKLAEILSQRDLAIFEPYHQPRRISEAIKRLQTVPEQRKWAHYFEDYGCMICHTRKLPHSALGKCYRCFLRVTNRLNSSIRRHGKKDPIAPQFITDLEQQAHAVLGRPLTNAHVEQVAQPAECDGSMGFIDGVEQARHALRKPRKVLPQHERKGGADDQR